MKRKLGWLITIIAIISMLATGCGPKGVDDIVGDLGTQVEKMQGYKMNAKLTLQTGKDPQTYDVEVWHNKPDFYRVALTSKERDITQIILRNDEGVFVLTPHLNKSFRFQSGWPENHAQVYLYESLVKSIVDDEQRVFAEEEGKYAFEVKADYQNRSLTTQKILLNKDLSPIKVDVMDSNKNVMVTVEFANFEKDAKFDADSFNKERNMETSKLDSTVPTMANGQPKEAAKGSFGVIQPTYMPNGVSFTGVEKVDGQEGPQVVLRYKGEYNYTLIESRPESTTVSYPSGEIVDLGYTMAVLTGDQKKTMVWTHDGVEYMLSGDMPPEEMMAVAKSTFDQVGK